MIYIVPMQTKLILLCSYMPLIMRGMIFTCWIHISVSIRTQRVEIQNKRLVSLLTIKQGMEEKKNLKWNSKKHIRCNT